MTDRSDILVVVPCLNEAAHIDGLLAQLAGDPGCASAEIVVADGGSTDATREIVSRWAEKDSRIRLLDNDKRIQSAGINAAVRHFGAGKTWLVRIDAHCGYPADYVARLIETIGRTGAQSVVVPMRTQGRGCFQRAVAAAQNSKLGTGGSAHRIGGQSDWIDHGHHAAWDITAFCKAGGYDETFSHNEDAELDFRLTSTGARIWLAADIPVVYFPRASIGRLFAQYTGYGKGRAQTLRRHRMRIKARQLLPLFVAPAVVLALAAPLVWPAAVPALVWAGACLGYGALLAGRTREGCVLASGLAAMTMHLAWSAGFWRQVLLARAPGDFAGGELKVTDVL